MTEKAIIKRINEIKELAKELNINVEILELTNTNGDINYENYTWLEYKFTQKVEPRMVCEELIDTLDESGTYYFDQDDLTDAHWGDKEIKIGQALNEIELTLLTFYNYDVCGTDYYSLFSTTELLRRARANYSSMEAKTY